MGPDEQSRVRIGAKQVDPNRASVAVRLCLLYFALNAYPRWSSGYDSALSQPRAGFDSPSGKILSFSFAALLLRFCQSCPSFGHVIHLESC